MKPISYLALKQLVVGDHKLLLFSSLGNILDISHEFVLSKKLEAQIHTEQSFCLYSYSVNYTRTSA